MDDPERHDQGANNGYEGMPSDDDPIAVGGRANKKTTRRTFGGFSPLAGLVCISVVAAMGGIGYMLFPKGTRLPRGYCEAEHVPMSITPDLDAADGLDRWAELMVSNMTEEEKHRLLNGAGWWMFQQQRGYYIGNILAIPRLGLPSINMQDAMQGFRTTDAEMIGQVTAWPCALALAATWDPNDVWEWSRGIGQEFVAKGANVILGPSVNVHRVARNGRNAEYLSGEDPTLGKVLAEAYVRGAQEGAGVAAVVKHFTLNHQETNRQKVDSHADEQTRWELYYPPFEAAINSNVAAVMCAYNYVNGEQACSNQETLTGDLKGRMSFKGFVMSDWWALQDGKSAQAGDDEDMPGTDGYYSDQHLSQMPGARVDEMARRVLTGMGRAKAYTDADVARCRVGCDCDDFLYKKNATSPEHVALARRLATEGAVLLKNEKNALPLKPGSKVALVGSACDQHVDPYSIAGDWIAADYYAVGGSGRVLSRRAISVADGLKNRNIDLSVSPTDNIDKAKELMERSDVVIACGGATAAESFDRQHLRLDNEAFISAVVAAGAHQEVATVVVAFAPGTIVAPWSGNASSALLMFLSGQQTGHAAADLLMGKVAPTGKLPVTLPKKESDAIPPCEGTAPCMYTERLHGGWHVYDDKQVEFPFGHGITYTTFEYTVEQNWSRVADSDFVLEMGIIVTNTGSVAAADIPQLYVQFPEGTDGGTRPLQLRGFEKTPLLMPGIQSNLKFRLGVRDLSIWNSKLHAWTLVHGQFKTYVGTSSRDFRLCGSFLDTEGGSLYACDA